MTAAVRVGTRGWRARGLITRESLDGGAVEEQETQSCRHCQGLLIVGVRADSNAAVLGGLPIGGYCSHCNSVLCETCERKRLSAASSKEACRPFAEVVEASMRRSDVLRACGI